MAPAGAQWPRAGVELGGLWKAPHRQTGRGGGGGGAVGTWAAGSSPGNARALLSQSSGLTITCRRRVRVQVWGRLMPLGPATSCRSPRSSGTLSDLEPCCSPTGMSQPRAGNSLDKKEKVRHFQICSPVLWGRRDTRAAGPPGPAGAHSLGRCPHSQILLGRKPPTGGAPWIPRDLPLSGGICGPSGEGRPRYQKLLPKHWRPPGLCANP